MLKYWMMSILLSQLFVLGTAQADEMDWPEITRECRPWTYWWWMGSAVTPEELQRHAKAYEKVGLGGMHIIPIYGPDGKSDRNIPFLSPEWMKMLDAAVSTADQAGLGVDMTPGTGWPYGGPWISAEEAASTAFLEMYSGDTPPKVVCKEQEDARLKVLMAYGPNGKTINLTDKVDWQGRLDWKPGGRGWTLAALFQGWTKQQVKRAAPGGEGNVLDHLSRKHLDRYLAKFDDAFRDYAGRKPRAFYADSYEVYGANWTDDFFDQFMKRRGYDLREHLHDLAAAEAGGEEALRVQSDYNETVGDLLRDEFAQPLAEWTHAMGAILRYEAHGSPGNMLDLYALSDSPETEGFGREGAEWMMTKFASSSAHLARCRLVSSESCTWLDEHFQEKLPAVKRAIDQFFLGGVNHVLFHGTAYSPADAPWPGWLFYASTHFGPTNTLYRDMAELNTYIARAQSFLQAGEPDADVAVYWPIYDLWAIPKETDKKKGSLPLYCLSVHGTKDWMHGKLKSFHETGLALREKGYTFDFISDRLMEKADRYKAVVVPEGRFIPAETVEKLAELAEKGVTVVFVGNTPKDVPGLGDLKNRRTRLRVAMEKLRAQTGRFFETAETVQGLMEAGVVPEPMGEAGIQEWLRHAIPGGKQYFIPNSGDQPFERWLPITFPAKNAVVFDLMTGQCGVAAVRSHSQGGAEIYLQVPAGGAWMIRAYDHPMQGEAWRYLQGAGDAIGVEGAWKVAFLDGGPKLPDSFDSDKLLLWTDHDTPETKAFSGTGKYSVSFNFDPKPGMDEWMLDLGRVCEGARVRVNGKDAGAVWCGQQLPVGALLKPGRNQMEVEVVNLMANRIADMGRQGEKWRNFFFVNIEYKDFDASGWPVAPSGLAGPVRLLPMKKMSPEG